MSQRILGVLAVAGVAAAFGAAGLAAAGQTDRSPDVLNALLVEVRGLRAAMEQMASAGPRVELALGRLQLQETRVNNLVRRHQDVRERLVSAERELDVVMRKLEESQEVPSRPGLSEEERQGVQVEIRELKTVVAVMQSDVQRLRLEETEVAQLVSVEQGRWTEINQQLEALEQSLAKR